MRVGHPGRCGCSSSRLPAGLTCFQHGHDSGRFSVYPEQNGPRATEVAPEPLLPFASQQSGPESLAGPPGAALKRVTADHNKGVGRRYGNFVQSCLAHSSATAAANGKSFLVVPVKTLPFAGWAFLP